MNVAIYVRVSTQEQKHHGISVDAQEAACRAWVQEHGHHLTGVYNDAGLSARAKYTKRKAMLQLIDDIRADKVDLIIFTKLDRWFRNVADYYEVQAILEQHGVKWRAIQEDYETETASGRFKVNIMLAVAQDEADRTSERIKAAADYKRAKGEAIGRAPIGYIIKDKRFEIDPETAPAIRAFFDVYLETFSRVDAMRALQDHGIIFNQTRCHRTLRNPTYAGDHFGTPCPAYITPEQYQTIRRHAEQFTRTRKTGRVYIFAGLLRCNLCGGALTSAAQPHRNRESYIKYYRCCNHTQKFDTCEGTYVNEAKLEAFLLDHLCRLNEEYYSDYSERKKNRKDQSGELRRLAGQLDRLKELYIDGEIERDAYDKRSASIKARIDQIEEESAEEPPAALDLPADWKETYMDLSDQAKRTFWQTNVKKIVIDRDAPPKVEF